MLRFSYILIFCILVLSNSNESLNFKDYFTTIIDAAHGKLRTIPDYLLTKDIFMRSIKDIVVGYPHKLLYQAIHYACSAAIHGDGIVPRVTPDIENMSFVLMTPNENHTFPLLKAHRMWTSLPFDPEKKVVVLVTGWQTAHNESNAVAILSKAYFCRGDTNFVVVDTARFIGSLYTWSAYNTEEVGEKIGRSIAELIALVPLENIHLIGHSLGAHIVGAAGRTFTLLTKKLLPRITGLDPANPCFNEGETLSGLQRGDAELVDIIHSNSGALGKRDPLGDIDFYPGGITLLPPGCMDMSCAHSLAYKYYAESVFPGNERNFLGVKCRSLYALKAGKCVGGEVPMGYAVPKNVKGNYVLDVNAKAPFGKNAHKDKIRCNQRNKNEWYLI